MSWLISFMLAGMMFTSQSGFNAFTADSALNPNIPQIVITAPQVVLLDETEKFEQTYPLGSNGKISISNVNGSITIEAWDKNEVKLEAVKTADTRENLGDVKIKIDSKPEYLRIETEYEPWKNRADGMWKNRKLEVQYRLWVPRGAILEEVATVNGSVAVSNMTNTTQISAVNGEVRATNLRGTTKIETVNGTVNADFESLQNVSEISLGAVNGTANLVIPSDAEATIKAETVNGRIANDFGLPVRKGKYVGSGMYGRVGNGNVKINLETVNGTMNIRRRQDGKNVNPATNLLPAKSEDDDETAVVAPRRSTAAVNSAKINAEVAKAMKNAAKDMEKARVEMEAIQPRLQEETMKAVAESMKIAGQAMTPAILAGISEAARLKTDNLRQIRTALRGNWMPVVERKTETFNVRGTPKVTVNAQNCKVFVRGWEKSEVQYSVIKLSRDGNQTPLQYKARQDGSDVNIEVSETTEEADSFGANQVRVEVFVPKKSNLRILTSKEIRVEGVTGEVNLTGANEAVNIRDVAGKLAVSSEDGAVRIIGFTGELIARTVEGMINLEGDFQKLTAESVQGTIVLTLPDGINATLNSNAEEITAQGFSLVRDSSRETVWRVGKGGLNFNLNSADGQIIVRNANLLIAGL